MNTTFKAKMDILDQLIKGRVRPLVSPEEDTVPYCEYHLKKLDKATKEQFLKIFDDPIYGIQQSLKGDKFSFDDIKKWIGKHSDGTQGAITADNLLRMAVASEVFVLLSPKTTILKMNKIYSEFEHPEDLSIVRQESELGKKVQELNKKGKKIDWLDNDPELIVLSKKQLDWRKYRSEEIRRLRSENDKSGGRE